MNRYLFDEKGKIAKALAVLTALIVAVGLFGGCGKNGQTGALGTQGAASEETDRVNTNTGTGEADEKGDASENGEKAMGRYVENPIDLSEYVTKDYGVTQLADGSILVLDEKVGQIISTDGGETWETKPIPGIDDMDAFTEDNYVFQMRAGLDGTVYVLSSPNTNGTGEFHVGILVGRPDGSSQVIEELTDEGLVSDIWVSPENRLFVRVSGASCLYELNLADGSLSNYMTLEFQPDLVQFQGDYMILMTAYEGVTFYDMKEEKVVADDVLKKFMEENYLGEYYADESFTVYVVPGEEEVVYIAGKGGVYRHVIGGSAMEQIIDGGLSSFSNPAMSIVNMITLDNNEFMVLFTGGRLVRYTYDPNVPTVPDKLVTVYSLREEDKVRQAIAQYQAQNPQAFVRYEVGLSGSDAVSREDAIKKLNTELMAGGGPDILILDGLPMDSYIEKGVLLDLSDHISQMTGEQELMPNIVESFRQDGKIYGVPVTFTIPAVFGREEDLAQIHDLASLADTMERLREENPGQEIIGMFSEETAVKWLFPVSASSFVDKAGNLDTKVVAEYLEEIDRIYKASLDGISDTLRENHENRRQMYREAGPDDYYAEAYNSLGNITMNMLMEDAVFGAGNLMNTFTFQELLSINKVEGYETMRLVPLDGHCSHVFVPDIMTGINASSAHPAEAEAFFDVLMGKEVQQLLYDGFVVNKVALESQLSPDWMVMSNSGMNVDYGEVSSSIGGSTGDGREYSMDIYMPTREEYQELYDIFCKLDTPYVAEKVMEDAVAEYGTQYLSGYLSLEQAVQKIQSKVELYMAE